MLLLILVLVALVINKNPYVRTFLIFCLLFLFITSYRTYITSDPRILLSKDQLYTTQISVEPKTDIILWSKAPIKINNGMESKGICSIKLNSDKTGRIQVDIVKSSIEDIYIEDVIVYYKYLYKNGSVSPTESMRLIYYDTELQQSEEHFEETEESIDETSDKKRQTIGNVVQPDMNIEFTDDKYDEKCMDKYFSGDIPTHTAPDILDRLNDRNFTLDQYRKPTYSGDDVLSDYSNNDKY